MLTKNPHSGKHYSQLIDTEMCKHLLKVNHFMEEQTLMLNK